MKGFSARSALQISRCTLLICSNGSINAQSNTTKHSLQGEDRCVVICGLIKLHKISVIDLCADQAGSVVQDAGGRTSFNYQQHRPCSDLASITAPLT